MGAHAVPDDAAGDSDAEDDDDDEQCNDSDDNDQQSVHFSRKTCVKCVWCVDATQDKLLYRAGTSVSVHLASHSWSNRLAVAQYADLTSLGPTSVLTRVMFC